MKVRGASMAVTAALVLAAAAAVAGDVAAGIAHYNAGRYAQAETALRDASGLEGKAYLAAALAKQSKYAEAEAAARAALALQERPTQEVAVGALGESLVGQRKFDAAVERMTASLAAKSDLAYAYYWRGHAHNGKSQPDRTVADFEAFLKLAPRAPEAPAVQRLLASLR